MADPSIKFKEERVTKPHPDTDRIKQCAISPDGSLVVTAREGKQIIVTDAATGNVIHTVEHDSSVEGVAWHPDGNRFVVAVYDGILTEFIRSNGSWSCRTVYDYSTAPNCCAMSTNGLLAVCFLDEKVAILDSNSNYSVKQEIDNLTDFAFCVAFSSNGSFLAFGCPDGIHSVYGLNQSKGEYEQLTLQKQKENSICSISISPLNSHLILESDDGTASLWNIPSSPMDPSTWPQMPSFVFKKPHCGFVQDTCFTGDGRHVIVALTDNNIHIWRTSDCVHVGTLIAKNEIYSLSFYPRTGRLIAALSDGSLQSWRCPPDASIAPPSFVDARLRLSKAEQDVTKVTKKLSSAKPSVRDACAKAAQIKSEIVQFEEQIEERKRQLALIETAALKKSMRNYEDLEEQLQFANGEIFNCNRIVDHVTECSNGYFSSLQAGVFFDQWLFDSGLKHLTRKLTEMDGDRLVHMSIFDLLDCGVSYVDACDIHIRACVTVHMHKLGDLPGVFNWDKDQVSTWLESQGESYASLVNQGWTGPSLIALSPNRIEAASNKTIKTEDARSLREMISALVKSDTNLPQWMRKWNGGLSVVDYAE